MKALRVAFVSFLVVGIFGCGFVDSQLSKDPQMGASQLQNEVKAVAPLAPAPWGDIAVGVATLITAIYGAFHAKAANENTKPAADPAPTPKPTA